MSTLHVQRVDDLQSEIWLDGYQKQLVTTSWVLVALARVCDPRQFQEFVDEFEGMNPATAIVRDVDETVDEFRLKIPEDAALKYGLIG